MVVPSKLAGGGGGGTSGGLVVVPSGLAGLSLCVYFLLSSLSTALISNTWT